MLRFCLVTLGLFTGSAFYPKEDFDVDLDRESIVSALTKKVKSGRIFTRLAPNTFAILDSASDNNSYLKN